MTGKQAPWLGQSFSGKRNLEQTLRPQPGPCPKTLCLPQAPAQACPEQPAVPRCWLSELSELGQERGSKPPGKKDAPTTKDRGLGDPWEPVSHTILMPPPR